jgi:hypothetical protein
VDIILSNTERDYMAYDFIETVGTAEAIEMCEANNIDITRWGLAAAGSKAGFSKKTGEHWLYDKKGVQNYISSKAEQPPKGWMSISDLSAKTGMSRKRICTIIRKENVETKYFLSFNKLFVDAKSIVKFQKESA